MVTGGMPTAHAKEIRKAKSREAKLPHGPRNEAVFPCDSVANA